MILFYDCDEFILRTIENCAPHVEKIYISYSPEPWKAYNPKARSSYKNPSDKDLIKQSRHYDKIELIEGVWETDEGQRTTVLDKAKAEGFDYIIVQDADEFYLEQDYKRNLDEIRKNPDFTSYRVPWIKFWKNKKYVLECRDDLGGKNNIYGICGNFAINLNKRPDLKLTFARITNYMNDTMMLSGMCFHFSWVLTDEQVLRKISTWGHSHQVEIQNWYRYKWLGWTPSSKNLNPVSNITAFTRAIPYFGPLPSEMIDFPIYEHQYKPLTFIDLVNEKAMDIRHELKYQLKLLWRKIKS